VVARNVGASVFLRFCV